MLLFEVTIKRHQQKSKVRRHQKENYNTRFHNPKRKQDEEENKSSRILVKKGLKNEENDKIDSVITS